MGLVNFSTNLGSTNLKFGQVEFDFIFYKIYQARKRYVNCSFESGSTESRITTCNTSIYLNLSFFFESGRKIGKPDEYLIVVGVVSTITAASY